MPVRMTSAATWLACTILLTILPGLGHSSTPPPAPPPAVPRCAAAFNLVLVIDNSGSMLNVMNTALDVAVSILDQVDLNVARVGLVRFSTQPQIRMLLSDNRAALTASIRSISASGQTFISAGLLSGVTVAKNSPLRVSSRIPDMIWLLTDGVQTPEFLTDGIGGDRAAIQTAKAIKANGTTIYSVGIGAASNQTMEMIASAPADIHSFVTCQTCLQDVRNRFANFCNLATSPRLPPAPLLPPSPPRPPPPDLPPPLPSSTPRRARVCCRGRYGLTIGSDGTLYVADSGNHRIRTVSQQGDVKTLAGTGAPGHKDGSGGAAQFFYPVGIAMDSEGCLFVTDRANHRIRKVTTKGTVSTLAGSGRNAVIDGKGQAAAFSFPNAIALDRAAIYVSDTFTFRIRRILKDGQTRTLAIGFPPPAAPVGAAPAASAAPPTTRSSKRTSIPPLSSTRRP